MKKENWISSWVRLLLGLVAIFLFTQINWTFFIKNNVPAETDIDNTALFYTESEKAMNSAFFNNKSKD